jgi:hypothetical protein
MKGCLANRGLSLHAFVRVKPFSRLSATPTATDGTSTGYLGFFANPDRRE